MTPSVRSSYRSAATVAVLAFFVSPIGLRLLTGRADLSFRLNAVSIVLALFLLAIVGALLTRERLRQAFFVLILCLVPLAALAGVEALAIGVRLADRIAPLEDVAILANRGNWPGHLMSDARWQPGTRLYRPWEGPGISINALGLRTAPPRPKRPGEWRVAVTGGSAVWGWRVVDADTIPEQLARLVTAKHPDVTVFNFGIEGATIAQELAVLRQFRETYGIDQVIFYTGANDVFGVYLDVAGGKKQRVDATSGVASFELVKTTARFMQTMTDTPPAVVGEMEQKLLARVRERNPLRAGVEAADQYCKTAGLRCDVVLQPMLFTRAHPVGPEARLVQMFRRLYPGFNATADAMYRGALSALPNARIRDLSGIFDHSAEPVLMDNVHLNERGNRIVAARLAGTVTLGPE